ncbi:MAG: class I adenylate-forming enzyme family protein [Myxococcota bacterium]
MTATHAPTTVPTLVRTLAERYGDRELIVADESRLSYAEAEMRSARMARGLLAAGIGKGTRVGLLMPNGPEWVLAWLAATRIGALVVPLNTFFQTRELAWVLRHADVDTLLAVPRFLSHDYASRLEEAALELAGASASPLRLASLPLLRRIYLFGDCDRSWACEGAALEREAGGDALLDDGFLARVEATVTPADLLVMLYSSGSTSDPKAALHTHGSVLRHSHNLAQLRGVGPEDRVWSPMPFFWVGGFVFAFLSNLHAGACTLCEEAFEPASTLAFLERERATLAIGWPHFGKALAEHPSRSERDLSSLRGGTVPDILPPEVCPTDPELRANALGMTETCGPHTWGGEGALPEALRGSFGRAVPGVEHCVVDPDTAQPLPPGSTGEICVRGESLMQGLYKVERPDTFTPDGFYRTGDSGFFDADGVLYFKGRLGEMIKTGGANVTPSEVEQVLVSYPGVKEAYVVGLPDPERGQQVAASVVLEEGAQASSDELRGRLRRDLSAYKVPRQLFVDDLADLPFTDSGKIDKRRLVELLEKRVAGER